MATSDPNRPLWPPCVMLEWFLLGLDDKAYKKIYQADKVPGRDIPLSGDPLIDEQIIRYYQELDRGKADNPGNRDQGVWPK
jgi:hypothetical protein